MKVPKHMQDKINQCTKHFAKANTLNKEIENWIINQINLLEDEDIPDAITDQLIDCMQMECNPHELIKYLEELDTENII